MKKVLSFIVLTAILVSVMPIGASAAFPDIDASHWAYAQVERLVSEGTINGLPDGSFNPTGVVSRAEFVKMLGKSSVKFSKDFADVNPEHWAYEYIMYSQLEGDLSGKFNPSAAITRGDVANLLYKRFGANADTKAPYSISSQGTNPKATAWVYNTGLMIGGDKINLRMEDTLTRAEAAVLIVRAKDLKAGAYTSFADRFSADVYKNMYEKSDLFDTAYEESGNITYEELSAAAMRYQYKSRTPAIRYVYEPQYEGDYAMYWDIACRYALDEKNYDSTKENGAKYATLEDALAILTLGAKNNMYINGDVVEPDGKTYSDVKIASPGSKYAEVMSYAYNFGISLKADGTLDGTRLATKKDVGAILMQYQLSFGSQAGYHCGYNSQYLIPYTRIDPATYPSNSSYYANIADDIPNFVYEKPFITPVEVLYSPKVLASDASLLGHIYATSFMYVAESAYAKGAMIYLDFYPTLCLRLSDNKEIYRVKIIVDKPFQGMKLSDILALEPGVEDRVLSAGDSFWCDINSNQSTIGKLYIDYTIMSIGQIVG